MQGIAVVGGIVGFKANGGGAVLDESVEDIEFGTADRINSKDVVG